MTISNNKNRAEKDTLENITVQVSYYKNGEETEIVKLLGQAMNGWPVHKTNCDPEEHWRWKHLDTPTGHVYVVIASVDGKIVGCDHVHSNIVKVFDKVLLSGIACDTAVHSDYRKKGIYNKMAELTQKKMKKMGVYFGYWITSNPIFINLGKKRNRPTLPFKLVKLVWVDNLDEYLLEVHAPKIILKKILIWTRSNLLRLVNSSQVRSKKTVDCAVRDVKHFGYDTDIFWKKVNQHFDFIIERKTEYLNYRYCDDRAGDYSVKAVYRNEEMLGYCVVALTKQNQAKIIDFLVLPNELDAANTLLLHVIDYVIENKRNSLILWVVNNSTFHKLFSSNNFMRTNIYPHIFFFEQAIDMEEWKKLQSLNSERVHFAFGDTDLC
jgi:hypothetical protein